MKGSVVAADTHERAWEKIPWLVNGQLSREDVEALEAHIANCGECRDERALQARIHDAMSGDDSLAFASEASYRKLSARMDASPRGFGFRGREPQDARRTVRWLAAALAIESIGLAAWGAWTWRAHEAQPSLYVTLGEPQRAAVADSSVRVVFRPESTLAEIQTLLRSVDARLVDGPTESGVYTLELVQQNASSTDRLATLRASQLVRLAEPVR